MGATQSNMKWPPKVKNIEILGELRDTNGRPMSRDGGSSWQFGGHWYYVFGDTFCTNDQCEFVGLTNNTVGVVRRVMDPTRSSYLTDDPLVPEFVPLTPSEKAFYEVQENKDSHRRIVTWCNGGAFEDSPGSGTGYIFFDKIGTRGGETEIKYGTGVARITQYDGTKLRVERDGDTLIWGPDDPGFSNHFVHEDGHVYLFATWEMNTLMARAKQGSNFFDRANYEFFTNSGWSSQYNGVADLQGVPGLGCLAGAKFFKLPDGHFAPTGRPFCMIGGNIFGDGNLYVGCAEKMEGPWECQVVCEIPKVLGEKSAVRYCICAHPWAYNPSIGQMMITWSDNGHPGGKVECAMFDFEMEDPPPPPAQEREEQGQGQGQEQQEPQQKNTPPPVPPPETRPNYTSEPVVPPSQQMPIREQKHSGFGQKIKGFMHKEL